MSLFEIISLFTVFLVIELPYISLLFIGIIGYFIHKPIRQLKYEKVCIGLTCYSEKELIELSIESIAKQTYPLELITVLVVVDGGSKFNSDTVQAGYRMQKKYPQLNIVVIDKDNRYGRVHSNNLAIKYCNDNKIPYLMILDGDTSINDKAVESFMAMDYDGISGNIKVRNLNTIVTKLTYLEYSFGIVLARLGLSQFGYTSNLSGAFAFWKVSALNKIGGYRPNSGEDFDATLRAYIHKLKLSHCNGAVAYTDSPETLKGLLKQRLTWDGDLVFIYGLYKHYMTPLRLGFSKWFFLWYSWIMSVGLPFCLIPYSMLLAVLNPQQTIVIMGIVYMVYLSMCCVLFCIYMILCEQKEVSLSKAIYLPLFPLYAFIIRVNGVIAYMLEWCFNWHLSSKMAPKRVLLRAHLEKSEKYLKF